MASDKPSESAATDLDGEAGVFGNLPKTRPGARSPRRDAAAAKSTKSKPSAPKSKAKAPATSPSAQAKRAPRPPRPPEAVPPPPPPRTDPAEPEHGPDEQRGGLEEVAWAGVAAAAEAATIGVRLANRAFGAMRDAVDRR
ncbi:MAG: hypothetical protein ACR2G3_03805 [Solirubrobacterales bacterium]